jgi:hypothetical protein
MSFAQKFSRLQKTSSPQFEYKNLLTITSLAVIKKSNLIILSALLVPIFQCYHKYSPQGEARIHLHHSWPPEKLMQGDHYTSLVVCLPAKC